MITIADARALADRLNTPGRRLVATAQAAQVIRELCAMVEAQAWQPRPVSGEAGHMTPIDELIRRLEAAGPDRGLDGAIAVASGQYDEHFQGRDGSRANEGWVSRNGGARVPAPRYTGSIDAAISLVPAGWEWMTSNRARAPHAGRAYVHNKELINLNLTPNPRYRGIETTAATPALAICIASLRARAATERTEE